MTPANSSGVTDGAAFIVVADRKAAEGAGIRPRARIVDYAIAGVPPRIMGCGPVPATRKLLERQGLKVSDIDYFEVNEAFASVNLHAEAQLCTPRDATNLYGGGISIGHPPGATGVRMAMTAIQHLEDVGGRRAVSYALHGWRPGFGRADRATGIGIRRAHDQKIGNGRDQRRNKHDYRASAKVAQRPKRLGAEGTPGGGHHIVVRPPRCGCCN